MWFSPLLKRNTSDLHLWAVLPACMCYSSPTHCGQNNKHPEALPRPLSFCDWWHSFFSISVVSTIEAHIHEHTHIPSWRGALVLAHCISEIQSLAPLFADVSKNPIFCCSIVWVEIEAHHWECKVTEHISTKSPISLLCSCALLLSPSICRHASLSFSCTHTHTHTSTLYLCCCRALLFIHSTSHEQTAPWMPWPQVHWNSHNSLPDCKISGLSIWTQWLRASIYQDVESVESWSHC